MGGTRTTTPIGPKFQEHKGNRKKHPCTKFEGSIFIGFRIMLVWPKFGQKLLESEAMVRSQPYGTPTVLSLLLIYSINFIKMALLVFELSCFWIYARQPLNRLKGPASEPLGRSRPYAIFAVLSLVIIYSINFMKRH